MSKINVQSLDTAERDWEYDDDGTRIYKVRAGKPLKTKYKDDYERWKDRYGWEWNPDDDLPYYVDLP